MRFILFRCRITDGARPGVEILYLRLTAHEKIEKFSARHVVEPKVRCVREIEGLSAPSDAVLEAGCLRRQKNTGVLKTKDLRAILAQAAITSNLVINVVHYYWIE